MLPFCIHFQVKITVLEDNDPLAQYRYLLSINTGHRHGASTSSQVSDVDADLDGLTAKAKPI